MAEEWSYNFTWKLDCNSSGLCHLSTCYGSLFRSLIISNHNLICTFCPAEIQIIELLDLPLNIHRPTQDSEKPSDETIEVFSSDHYNAQPVITIAIIAIPVILLVSFFTSCPFLVFFFFNPSNNTSTAITYGGKKKQQPAKERTPYTSDPRIV